MLLTKHEGETFLNQTVYISGQAFIRCNFVACTLVLRETVYHLEGCTFERCNWHVDWVLMWGSPEPLREIKALVAMIEQAQQRASGPSMGAPGAGMPGGNFPGLGAPGGGAPGISVPGAGVPGAGAGGVMPAPSRTPGGSPSFANSSLAATGTKETKPPETAKS